MRSLHVFLGIGLLIGWTAAIAATVNSDSPKAVLVTFDSHPASDKEGANGPLQDWESGSVSSNGNPLWVIEANKMAPSLPNVLRQVGNATSAWLTNKNWYLKDGVISCDLNIVEGKNDPEAGFVFRQKDRENFYYVRANVLKQNLVLYRMKTGQKESIKYADVSIPMNTWHKMKVELSGETFNVSFDGKLVMSARDNTFTQAGRFGFFTTADTKPAFDNLSFELSK